MTNNKQPLITIITVSFNAVTTIEETILSVINQTYSNIEYIIIDGGSKDGTVEIIKKYSDKIFYWVSEPDKGIYDAMNKGALKANGDYIQYLNASDRLCTNNTIENIVFELPIEIPDVVYGDIILEKEFGTYHMEPSSLDNFSNYFPIYHPSSWVRKELLLNTKFDTSLKIAADFKLFHSLYLKNHRFLYVPIVFTIFEAINGISNKSVYKSWLESQIVLKRNRGYLWPFKKIIVKMREEIHPIVYKIVDNFVPDYSKRKKYENFINNNNIKEEIHSL